MSVKKLIIIVCKSEESAKAVREKLLETLDWHDMLGDVESIEEVECPAVVASYYGNFQTKRIKKTLQDLAKEIKIMG